MIWVGFLTNEPWSFVKYLTNYWNTFNFIIKPLISKKKNWSILIKKAFFLTILCFYEESWIGTSEHSLLSLFLMIVSQGCSCKVLESFLVEWFLAERRKSFLMTPFKRCWINQPAQMIPLSGHGSLALRDLTKGNFRNASAWVGESSKSQCLILA